MNEEQELMLLIALILNQSIPSEQAWLNTVLLKERIKKRNLEYSIISFLKMESNEIENIIREGDVVLHRFPRNMSAYIHDMAYTVFTKFEKISNLWLNENKQILNDQEIVKNFATIPGIGKHKAIQGLYLLSVLYPINISNEYAYHMKKTCPNFLENYIHDIDIILSN